MQVYLFLVILIAAVFSLECEKGWISSDDHCYYKPPIQANYQSTLDICAELHSEVLTIDSKEEQDMVTKYLVNGFANIWLDALNSKYENWLNNTKDVKKPTKSVKIYYNCAIVMHTRRHESKWIKEDCNIENEVVCKKRSSQPIPTTVFPSTPTTDKSPTTTFTTTPKPSTCKPGWKQFGQKCYFVNLNKLNWTQAEDFCQSQGSHLSSVHSLEECEFIRKWYREELRQTTYIYLGGYSVKLPKFFWVDGTSFNYTNWYLTPRTDETYTILYMTTDANTNTIYNYSPTSNTHSVCSFYL